MEINYNLLNLFTEVKHKGSVVARYTYLADGTKLSVRDGSGVNGYDYLGSLTYKKSSAGLQTEAALFEDGVILADGSGSDREKINFFFRDHLGSVRVITDGNGAVKERNDYYPFGARHMRSDYAVSANRYKYNGKEKQTTGGLDYLDYGARMYDAGIGRWFAVDPLAEKYYSISLYAYATNNSVLFIDSDGQKLKITNNVAGAMNNIAQIAATSLGRGVVNRLISDKNTYNLNSVFRTSASSYIVDAREINYVEKPWYDEIPKDGGALTSMVAMGHEMMHAMDHSLGEFNEKNAGEKSYYLEPRAVSFANYLREVYSLSPLRDKYGNVKKGLNDFSTKGREKIVNFKSLGNNKDQTSYGYSYTTQTNKIDCWGMPVETMSKDFFIIISIDKDKNVNYRLFDNEKAYREAARNW